jgi:hypothetical protein
MCRRVMLALCVVPVLALAGCGAASTSTSSFSGAEREVAQTIANLQSYATSAEQKKICEDVVSSAIVKRLGGLKGCESAIKSQLDEVDNLELTIKSVKLLGGAKGTAASAQVSSLRSGKTRQSTLSLVKEGGRWKISGSG